MTLSKPLACLALATLLAPVAAHFPGYTLRLRRT